MGCFSGSSKVEFTGGGATAVEGSLTEGAAQHKTGFTMPLPSLPLGHLPSLPLGHKITKGLPWAGLQSGPLLLAS